MRFLLQTPGAALLALLAAAAPASGDAGEPAVAIFAGGCFWCVEADFDKVPGVLSTTSGYIGGSLENPTYAQVSAGGTGHREAVRIAFDHDAVSYEALLDIFWRSVDPTDPSGQFCDRGFSYTTAIYVTDESQRAIAEASRQVIEESHALRAPVVTPVETASRFYAAEDYHQDYGDRNPLKYGFYRFTCGRDARVREMWGAVAYSGIPSG